MAVESLVVVVLLRLVLESDRDDGTGIPLQV